ncbi:threonine synthase [Paenibacillus sp. FSL R7-0652]|uniref:threonine synthase n=1 Tax=Paenibacillus sp. FSL R7-0652 TaxID=2921687 RepID=UPI00315A71A0
MLKTALLIKCSECGGISDDKYGSGICHCGGTLLVNYDLERYKKYNIEDVLKYSHSTIWKYSNLLPLSDENSVVSLGEGLTPLIRLFKLEKNVGVNQLWIKREDQNPTGSFKARGFSVAVSLLKERKINRAVVPSNGNAGVALAAYAARANIEAYVIMPQDCPKNIISEAKMYGAKVSLISGFIHDAGKIVEQKMDEMKWINVGTTKELGRLEGKKTMAYELAEQLNWEMPDTIIYPTGGGSGLIGLWKGLNELLELGWISGSLPRFVSVQEVGCTPIVEGFYSCVTSINSIASPTGMRVHYPAAKKLIISILKNSGGTALAVSREEIDHSGMILAREGISASPEGSATLAGVLKLKELGMLSKSERVVLFNTAHVMKYL